uniref:Uncharacterized protein n=1 Tax=Plectus sambesii TaxID=2011161 RepID=A0A914UXK1_9BILA
MLQPELNQRIVCFFELCLIFRTLSGLPESKAIGELKHPELCIVAVKHLQQRLQASEESDRALDFATSNVCRLLQSICLHGDVNVPKLRQYEIVTHLHNLTRSLVDKEMQSSSVHQVLTLLAGFVCSEPSSKDLELIVKLLAEPNGFPAIVLQTLLEMMTETSFEPAECLVFPQVPFELLNKQKMSQSSPAGDVRRVNRSLSTKRRRGTVDDIEAAGDVIHSLDSLDVDDTLPAAPIRRTHSSVLDTLGRFFSMSSSLQISNSEAKIKDVSATLPRPRRSARQPYLPPFGHSSAAVIRLDRIGITLADGLTIAFWSRMERQPPP